MCIVSIKYLLINYCTNLIFFHIYRRRLPVVMVKLHMAQRVSDAAKFVEQGRIQL